MTPATSDVVTVRYFAGARAAAGGIPAEAVTARSLDELTDLLAIRHGERLAVVLKAASFLVDGLACHDRQAALPVGATVDVLPPFAGG
jgi:sulfur-carrier protein